MPRPWLRIAHRGASGEAPEHTRAALLRAIGYGVDMIEVDVHLSRDGELVVIHDADLGRTTNGAGAVREHDWAMLRTLDAGAWFDPAFAGERLLVLEEVVALVAGRARLNVEVKAPPPDWPVLAERLAAVLRANDGLRGAIVSCFDPRALRVLREVAPEASLGLLWAHPDVEPAWEWVRALQAVSFHPHWTLATAAVIDRAHRLGLQVLVWTVNDVGDMRRLVAEGVDGIISDFPERFGAVGG